MADWLTWLVGAVVVFLVFRSLSFILEFSLLYFFWTLAMDDVWAYGSFNALHVIFIVIGAVAVFSFFLANSAGARECPRQIDLILCSYTGNTAHCANIFAGGASEAGAQVKIHRLHKQERFKPSLDGDALVVAFPVFGWKPPWPLVEYLFKTLPRGGGKPAFILYTAGGGPENAGFVAWLLLALKGYRVLGRDWSVYPTNATTLRVGPAALWRCLDRLSPLESDNDHIKKSGVDFVFGKKTGLPLILSPSPLLIIGLVFDNRWINKYIYRNRVWKKRCQKCGLCVKYCPEGRLSIATDGFPRAQGSCALCMGCVNLCPKNAMHLLGCTEYGNPYKPRWPEYVYKYKN